MKSKFAICIFTVAISFFTIVSATTPFPSPFQENRFIGIKHSEITAFMVFDEYSPEYSATFTGGLVKEDLSTEELSDGQWVILPAGMTAEGSSTGEATVTLSHAANLVVVKIVGGIDVLGRLQLLDENDSLIEEFTFSSEGDDISWYTEANNLLASKLLVIIDGGTTETILRHFWFEDPEFQQNDGSSNEGSGAISPWLLLMILVGSLIRKARY